MKKLILTLTFAFLVSSCSSEPVTINSPCVGSENSPCGDKRPANPHLMHLYKYKV